MPRELDIPVIKICKGCNKNFKSFYEDKIWCSQKCRNLYYFPKPRWKNTQANCVICNKDFLKDKHNKIYCSSKCRSVAQKKFQKKFYKKDKNEKLTKKLDSISALSSAKEKYISEFNSLRFYKEKDFEHWFKYNYNLFGIKRLIKIDVWYPDVIAELYNGKIIRIELELNASNFIEHKHDPNNCELIISFIRRKKDTHIKGVPVISIFTGTFSTKQGNTDYNSNSLELTEYFNNLLNNFDSQINDFIKKNKISYPTEIDISAALEWKNKS